MTGELVLEVGCGSGRFTEQASATGATVISMDYSAAVDANYASNGRRENVIIVQGDLYRMPFRPGFFDRLFCFGVLQHTPRVAEAFQALPQYLKPGGTLAIDVYRRYRGPRRWLQTKYWVRPLTRRLEPETLYAACARYIETVWPFARVVSRLPKLGRRINAFFLISDYRGVYPLPEGALEEWAVLDTFDQLAPAYDSPQTLETVAGWFRDAGLAAASVQYCYNGIEGRATKPAAPGGHGT